MSERIPPEAEEKMIAQAAATEAEQQGELPSNTALAEANAIAGSELLRYAINSDTRSKIGGRNRAFWTLAICALFCFAAVLGTIITILCLSCHDQWKQIPVPVIVWGSICLTGMSSVCFVCVYKIAAFYFSPAITSETDSLKSVEKIAKILQGFVPRDK